METLFRFLEALASVSIVASLYIFPANAFRDNTILGAKKQALNAHFLETRKKPIFLNYFQKLSTKTFRKNFRIQ
jgi:hypothetical protein